MKIRRFREEDAKNAANLIKKALMFSSLEDYSFEVREEFIKGHSARNIVMLFNDFLKTKVFVAEENGVIVGTIGLKDNSEVTTMFVEPSHHGRGIGKKLFNFIEKIAKSKGTKVMKVYSSVQAEGFYTKLGFRRIRKIRKTLVPFFSKRKGKYHFPNIYMEKQI